MLYYSVTPVTHERQNGIFLVLSFEGSNIIIIFYLITKIYLINIIIFMCPVLFFTIKSNENKSNSLNFYQRIVLELIVNN